MRTSCNGCRVLRKGCSDECVIRPCLLWMKTADAQANATVFLAKFYGRAGLLNLLNAGPDHLRPAIFQSLLYEACGRVVDPIYGSVGLLYSGQWHHCQLAVDAVLKGLPIIQLNNNNNNNFNLYDIRHHMSLSSSSSYMDLRHHYHNNTSTVHNIQQHSPPPPPPTTLVPIGPRRDGDDSEVVQNDQSVSVEKHSISMSMSMSMSMFSGESTDGSNNNACQNSETQMELDLTLGFNKYSTVDCT